MHSSNGAALCCWSNETWATMVKMNNGWWDGLTRPHLLRTWVGHQCWPLSGAHRPLKMTILPDCSCCLEIEQLLRDIYVFVFPAFYCKRRTTDNKAQGVSGVPRTKALRPSALAWLSQSLASVAADWNAEWYGMSSGDPPHPADRETAGQL